MNNGELKGDRKFVNTTEGLHLIWRNCSCHNLNGELKLEKNGVVSPYKLGLSYYIFRLVRNNKSLACLITEHKKLGYK